MISYSDFEKAWFLYKTEYEPNNISINDFCIRKGLPYTEFYKWFRKTHKQIRNWTGVQFQSMIRPMVWRQ